MNKICILLLAILIFIFSPPNFSANSWDDEKTHKDISSYATNISLLGPKSNKILIDFGFIDGLDHYLKANNKNKKIINWMLEGSQLEDAGGILKTVFGQSRFFNHFHNPLQAWEAAGLNDKILVNYIS